MTTMATLTLAKKATLIQKNIDGEQRNQVLLSLADALVAKKDRILTENQKDLALLNQDNPLYDRLLLTTDRLTSLENTVKALAEAKNVLGKLLMEKCLANGLYLKKVVVPLGVVAVIYEARPNVTIDVFALCFKTANVCLLKGSHHAKHSNRVLVAIIKEVLEKERIDSSIIHLLPATKEAVMDIFQATEIVDVCIPRGSEKLISFVRDHAKVPVIETGAGMVHSYFDKSGDLKKGQAIIYNAKVRRVSVCNALDTLIIHEDRLDDLYPLVSRLADHDVIIFADPSSYQQLVNRYPEQLLNKASSEHFGQEFLSYKLSVKAVSSLQQGLAHIRRYSSKHSEAIIAEDKQTISYFFNHVDAAVVYANASTGFTDGGEFDMIAEIGISTQKLHARGPMGLMALTSYQWQLLGDGHIRG